MIGLEPIRQWRIPLTETIDEDVHFSVFRRRLADKLRRIPAHLLKLAHNLGVWFESLLCCFKAHFEQ